MTDSSSVSETVSTLSTIFVAPSFLILKIEVVQFLLLILNELTTGGFLNREKHLLGLQTSFDTGCVLVTGLTINEQYSNYTTMFSLLARALVVTPPVDPANAVVTFLRLPFV